MSTFSELFDKASAAYDREGQHSFGISAVIKALMPTAEQMKPRQACGRRYQYGEAGGGFVDSVLMDAPESWDTGDAAEHIALSYVATLEARLDAAGISRERWVE